MRRRKEPFGYELIVDCYECKPKSCQDKELAYRFLDGLVEKIGLTNLAIYKIPVIP